MHSKVEDTEQENDNEYEVEKILNRRINAQNFYYYEVKWVGYTKTTWEPITNLLGSEAVQKMIEDFQKKISKKAKKNWKNGLTGWAKTNLPQNYQNINKSNLDSITYQTNRDKNLQIIDLQKTDDHIDVQTSKKEINPFLLSSLRKKNTDQSNQQYPFQKVQQLPKHPFFLRKVNDIKKIQLQEGISKCLVRWKTPQNYEQWVPTDIVRLIAPEILVDVYERESLKDDTKKF